MILVHPSLFGNSHCVNWSPIHRNACSHWRPCPTLTPTIPGAHPHTSILFFHNLRRLSFHEILLRRLCYILRQVVTHGNRPRINRLPNDNERTKLRRRSGEQPPQRFSLFLSLLVRYLVIYFHFIFVLFLTQVPFSSSFFGMLYVSLICVGAFRRGLHDLYASLALAGWLAISFLFDVSLTFIDQARHCSQLKFCPRVGCECGLVVEYIRRAFVVVCGRVCVRV